MSRRWWRSVADNGAIVEQQMVATTHGLLPLLELLGLDGARLLDVARRCFSRLRAPAPGKAYLHARKDFAYGFRQMVLFLSLAGPEHQAAFFDELPVSEDLPEPVAAALLGLESAFRSAGGADAPSAGAHHAPLYGWRQG